MVAVHVLLWSTDGLTDLRAPGGANVKFGDAFDIHRAGQAVCRTEGPNMGREGATMWTGGAATHAPVCRALHGPCRRISAMFSWISGHPWAYPVLEVLHLFGIATLLGNLLLLELRVWGAFGQLPLPALARAALLLSGAGFCLAATSGVLMFASQPLELLANRAFTVKMLLLAAAGSNAAWFHGRSSLRRLDGLAKAQALLSLGLWLSVLACGRFIAYV